VTNDEKTPQPTNAEIMTAVRSLGTTVSLGFDRVNDRLDRLEQSDRLQWEAIGKSDPPPPNGSAANRPIRKQLSDHEFRDQELANRMAALERDRSFLGRAGLLSIDGTGLLKFVKFWGTAEGASTLMKLVAAVGGAIGAAKALGLWK
jgi:hypothetical protein